MTLRAKKQDNCAMVHADSPTRSAYRPGEASVAIADGTYVPARREGLGGASSGARSLEVGLRQRFNVVELAVVNMKSAILCYFEDVMKGHVPADVVAGIFGAGHQNLAGRFIRAAHAEDQRRAEGVQRLCR